MIVEVDHYPRCVYAIDGGHDAVILDALGFVYKASPPEFPPWSVRCLAGGAGMGQQSS